MEKNDGRKMICRRGYNFNRRNEKNKKETGSHTERICGFAGLLQKDSGTRHRASEFRNLYESAVYHRCVIFK